MFLFILILAVTFGLSAYASMRVKSAYTTYSEMPASSGLAGAEIAQRILDMNGITDVSIHPTQGELTDHYDPSNKRLVLSESNYYRTSVAALGVAAHEVGHAIQHKESYAPLQWRMAAVGLTTTAGMVIPLLGTIGVFVAPKIALPLITVAFGIVMLFQLITLPVEFDATARAKKALANTGAISPGAEFAGMSKVLDAAALTYVAAFISALGQFVYYAMMTLGGSRERQ